MQFDFDAAMEVDLQLYICGIFMKHFVFDLPQK